MKRFGYVGEAGLIGGGEAVPFQQEAADYLARYAVAPSPEFSRLVHKLVYDLKEANAWQYLVAGYLHCAPTQQGALLNLQGTTARDATLEGAPTFTAGVGFSSITSTKRVRWNFSSTEASALVFGFSSDYYELSIQNGQATTGVLVAENDTSHVLSMQNSLRAYHTGLTLNGSINPISNGNGPQGVMKSLFGIRPSFHHLGRGTFKCISEGSSVPWSYLRTGLENLYLVKVHSLFAFTPTSPLAEYAKGMKAIYDFLDAMGLVD